MHKYWLKCARVLLKLPEGNPALPAGDPASVRIWNPGSGFLQYRVLQYVMGLFPAAAFLVAFGVVGWVNYLKESHSRNPAPYLWLVPFAGVAVLIFGCILIAFHYAQIFLELDMLRYTLTDRALRLRRGVTYVEEVTLSYANIQNVQYSQGPIQRYFGIADLIVQTAGGGVGGVEGSPHSATGHRGIIQGVADPAALRDLILERVRAYRGDGLGAVPVETRPGHDSWNRPEVTALLKEIRTALASINAGGAGVAANTRWYMCVAGVVTGPMPREELDRSAAGKSGVLIGREGSTEWTKYS